MPLCAGVVGDTHTEIVSEPQLDAGTMTREWYTEERRRGNVSRAESRAPPKSAAGTNELERLGGHIGEMAEGSCDIRPVCPAQQCEQRVAQRCQGVRRMVDSLGTRPWAGRNAASSSGTWSRAHCAVAAGVR